MHQARLALVARWSIPSHESSDERHERSTDGAGRASAPKPRALATGREQAPPDFPADTGETLKDRLGGHR
jgi:hypothetical protein